MLYPSVTCDCGEDIDPRRADLGYTTCTDCGEKEARAKRKQHIIAIPYSKGAYQYVHDPRDLFNTNPKHQRG
jgi:hypothetical protein